MRSAGADLIGEPYQSRVIVSFLLNRIRAQQCGGFRPPVNRTAGSRPRLPAGQPLGSVSSSGVYMRETDRGRPAVLYCMAAASVKQDKFFRVTLQEKLIVKYVHKRIRNRIQGCERQKKIEL